jgi:DNA-binding NarL/FixJ family response regulator
MIRVMVADDHPLLREGLRRVLEARPDIRVVAETDSGTAVLTGVAASQPDVLVMDLSLPGPPIGELLEALGRAHPGVAVVALGEHSDDADGAQVLRGGAAGYLTKRQPAAEVVQAVGMVAGGGRYIPPSLAELLLQEPEPVEPPSADALLTRRETEVLALLGEGLSTKQAAGRLGVSPKTVSTHRAAILSKLSLRGTADLVRYCLEMGILR